MQFGRESVNARDLTELVKIERKRFEINCCTLMIEKYNKHIDMTNAVAKIAVKLLLLVAVFMFATQTAQARHIIGGEITYECIGRDTINNTVRYRFTLKLYRDCFGGGAEFDTPADIGIFEQLSDGSYRHIRTPGSSPILISLS